MIGRLFYHSFWSFYDHLGVLTLAGIAQTLALTAALSVLFGFGTGLPGLPALAGFAILFLLLLAVPLAGMLHTSALAATGKVARLPGFLAGVKAYWGRIVILMLLFAAAGLICVINARFYMAMDTTRISRSVQFFLMLLAGLHGWILLLLAFMASPVFSAATTPQLPPGPATAATLPVEFPSEDIQPSPFHLRKILKAAMLSIVLAPGLWAFVTLSVVILLAVCFWSKVGLLIYLPLVSVISHTAFFLTNQHAEFIAAARTELGCAAKYSQLKARARELALQWEYKQPRRTAKELIRPWEY